MWQKLDKLEKILKCKDNVDESGIQTLNRPVTILHLSQLRHLDIKGKKYKHDGEVSMNTTPFRCRNCLQTFARRGWIDPVVPITMANVRSH